MRAKPAGTSDILNLVKTFLSNLKRMFTVAHGDIGSYIPHRHASLEDRISALEVQAKVVTEELAHRLVAELAADNIKKDKKK